MAKPSQTQNSVAKKGTTLIIVILLILLVAVGIYAALSGNPKQSKTLYDAAIADMTIKVEESRTKYNDAATVYSDAKLSAKTAEDNYKNSESALVEAEEKYEQARLALINAQIDTDKAQADFLSASSTLNEAREAYASASLQLIRSQSNLSAALTAYEDAKAYYEESSALLDSALENYNKAIIDYQSATDLINSFLDSQGVSAVLSAKEIYNRTIDAIVEIRAYDVRGSYFKLGSGFFIEKDDKVAVVTNYHVIQNAFRLEVFHNDGNFYEVTSVLGYDADIDIAIIQIDKKDCLTLKIADKKPQVGDTVYAAGSNTGLTRTFTKGIVSYVDREIEGFEANSYIHYVGITHSGNSGGAILNAEGEVIGVHQLGDSQTGDNGLAIPISQLQKIAWDKNETPQETTFNNAADISDKLYYYVGQDNKITITGVRSLIEDTIIRIPSQIDGKEVVALDWGNNSANIFYVEHIIVSEGIKSIGDLAFSSANYLISVKLPSTLQELSETSFSQTTELYKIFLEDNAFFTLTEEVLYDIAHTVLYKYPLCKSYEDSTSYTESYTVPAGVQTLCEYAIFYALGLRTLDLPAGLKSIGTMGISYCLNLKSINISEGLEFIGIGALSTNINLTSVSLPSSLKTLGESLDDGSGYIYKGVFFECLSLKSVTFAPNSEINSIGDSVFGYCQSLTSVIGLTGVNIGNAAFLYCLSLKNIDISALTVTNLGISAFKNCMSLISLELPQSLTVIANNTFNNCSNLIEITLPSGITSIGEDAFYGAIRLLTAALPESLTSIGDGAFYGCQSLSVINLKDTVITYLGAYSFCGSGLTSVTLPNTLSTVSQYAFASSKKLVYLKLAANTLWLKDYAFADCTELKVINAAACVYPPHLSDATVFEGVSEYLVIDIPEESKMYYEYNSAWMVYRNYFSYV